MRVLGIAPSSTDLKLALVEGALKEPAVIPLASNSQKLPTDECEGHALLSLRRFLYTFLREKKVERICVLRATGSRHRGPSLTRVKTEAIIQLVGAELPVTVDLVAPQTLRAAEKRFAKQTSQSPEEVLNGGSKFRPKAWRDAVLVAWWGLDE